MKEFSNYPNGSLYDKKKRQKKPKLALHRRKKKVHESKGKLRNTPKIPPYPTRLTHGKEKRQLVRPSEGDSSEVGEKIVYRRESC